MLTVLARHLRRRGMRVTESPSALHALQVLEQQRVNVVVTDLRMPGPGGLVLLRQLADSHPEVWRVILSGWISAGIRADPVVDLALDKGEDDAMQIIEAILEVARRPPRDQPR